MCNETERRDKAFQIPLVTNHNKTAFYLSLLAFISINKLPLLLKSVLLPFDKSLIPKIMITDKKPTSVFSIYLKVVIILLLYSCVTQRDLEYMQSDTKDIQKFDEANIEDYRLKPNDELYIQISSIDDPASSIFSTASTLQINNMGGIQPYGASLTAYTINKDGYLFLPVIGQIAVLDKTTAQVSESITSSLDKILNKPMVSVKLVNRYVSVLGEVKNPGHYAYSQDKLTIYDALGLAGDISDFGNRREVILTRNENGQNLKIPINLTQAEILSSNYYYICPNDMIYVKPMPRKFWGIKEFPYSVLISGITAAILLYSVVK